MAKNNFEPSQPQKITSGLKTMFKLSPIFHPADKVIKPQIINNKKNNYKTKQKQAKPVLIQMYRKRHKHQTIFFQRMSPFSIAPVKKAHKARIRWFCGPLCRFINTRFF